MPKPNNDLVSTKITRVTKNQLAFIKSQSQHPSQGDYAALAPLVQVEFDRLRQLLVNQG